MSSSRLKFVKNHFDYIGLLCLIGIVTVLQLFKIGYNINNGIILENTLDFSWQTDTIERLLHGYLAGRDFIFTYGPLHQFITSVPALILDLPSYISLLYAQVIIIIIVCLLLFFIIKEVTSNKLERVILLCILLFIVDLFSYAFISDLIRILLPFLFALLYLKHISLNRISIGKTAAILSLPAIFGLYTFDLFLLCLMITICLVIFKIWLNFKTKSNTSFRKMFVTGIIHICIIFLFAIVISLILTQNLNYLLYSFDTVKNYQFIMNIPWSLNKSLLLFIYPATLLAAFFYLVKSNKVNTSVKTIFTILTITALLQLKSGFIRSDEGHIIMAVYPSVIILFLSLFLIYKERKIVFLFGIVLYLLLPFKSGYYEYLSLSNLKTALVTIVQQKPFFEIYKLPSDYYIPQNELKKISSLFSNNPNGVMVYPYDSFIINIHNQTYNMLPLQWYDYSNSLVENEAVKRLEKTPPKFIILGVDTSGVIALDDIPNFTRNPVLAKWILTNYSVDVNKNKYIILRFNPKKSISPENQTCNIYDVDISQVIQSHMYEGLGKPATYFIKTQDTIRIPFTPTIHEVFVIENYNDPKTLQKLFDRNINIHNSKKQVKNISIHKMGAVPIIQEKLTTKLPVRCY